MTRVLVTGVAGFIGSHVADALVERGDQVWGVDDFNTGLEYNVADDVVFVEGDIADEWTIDTMLERSNPDVIVHAAATYADPDDWHRDLAVNADATALIADRAAALGCHLVYFQTSLCYGHVNPTKPTPIDHPLDPQSSYAISKVAGERYIRLSGCEAAVFRLANMYGPRNLSGPLPAFWKRLTAGEPCSVVDSRRDFVFVDDLVRLVLAAIDDRADGTWHASTGSDYSISDLYETVVSVGGFAGSPVPARIPRAADDVASLLLDPADTLKRFGWAATTSLEQGVRRAVNWYDEHGVDRTFTHLRVNG